MTCLLLLSLHLLVLPEVVGPSVVHIGRIYPSCIEHKRIECTRMAVSEICGLRKKSNMVKINRSSVWLRSGFEVEERRRVVRIIVEGKWESSLMAVAHKQSKTTLLRSGKSREVS